jgi:glycosyltransferase involved in cell wall biosynthesis
MRIGVDALFDAHGGCLANLRMLLAEWHRSGALKAHHLTVFASPRTAARLAGFTDDHMDVVVLGANEGGVVGRFFYEQVTLPGLLRRGKIEVVFCPANTMPFAAAMPAVATFQNAAPFCERLSEQGLGVGYRVRFALLGLAMRITASRARRVIFVSRYFQKLFEGRHGFEPERGVVIYRTVPGTYSAGVVALPAGVRAPFILNVSHAYPYKNLVELVRGFAQSTGRLRPDVQLVIAGDHESTYGRRVREEIRTLGIADRVLLTGPVAPEAVEALLRGCEFFVFPSTCENCPTALIEAIAAGVPIVCSDAGVMPEIAGDAAVYFDGRSPSSISEAIVRLEESETTRAELRRRCAAACERFPTPAAAADATLAAILHAGERGA